MEQSWEPPIKHVPISRIPTELGDPRITVIAGRVAGSTLQLAVFEALNPNTTQWDLCYIAWDTGSPAGGLIGCARPASPGIGVFREGNPAESQRKTPDYIVWGPLPEATARATVAVNGIPVAEQSPSALHVMLLVPLSIDDTVTLEALDEHGRLLEEARIVVR
ncbi:MAG: hypothetical protein WEA29_04945 [Acidimicrobiia bacterium]